MLDYLAEEERALRRRLLFRLLKNFDFDKPSIQHELISDLVTPYAAIPGSDHFAFAFEAYGN
ncbi:MAG: hypothetical protein QNJ09_00690 [Paracoccaceae bacterium]|nr:hypothetical protein [Paracoccaceae bacterium]